MNSSFDTIIVGAGIAGAAAAWHCAQSRRTLVLEGEQPGAGASGVAAGLVNPFMGRKAQPVWRWKEALAALDALLKRVESTDVFQERGILRPARDEEQKEILQKRAADYPEVTEWWSTETVQRDVPAVDAPHGALYIRKGGAIAVKKLVNALLNRPAPYDLHVLTNSRVTAWGEEDNHGYVVVNGTNRLYANHVILAMGAGYRTFDSLQQLPLDSVKGQTVTVRLPNPLAELPCLSGYGYVAPSATPDVVTLGSTYEHDFDDIRPRSEATAYILEKVEKMLPAVRNSHVLSAQAGIRVMHRTANRVLMGPLPEHHRIWVFSGLGSKGLLMAPLTARKILDWLRDPNQIPTPLRPDRTRQ